MILESKYFWSIPLVTQMVKSTEGRENSRRKSSSKRRLYVPLGVAHSCFTQNRNKIKMLEKSAKDFLFAAWQVFPKYPKTKKYIQNKNHPVGL